MSRLLAAFIYRWRYLLTAASIAGAVAFAPRANITNIDNDITAWFSKDDPVYQDYERFRQEFAGTRSLIVALEAESAARLFSRETLDYIERITGDIERVDTVQRVDSLATATIVEAVADGLEVRPLIDLARRRGPDAVRERALDDELIRGDLVSTDATVTALIVSFDEDRIDAVRAGVIQRIHDIVDPALPAGIRAHYNGSLEISETYNRITLDNQRRFTPPILLFTVLAIYATFRSLRKTFLALIAVGISVLWTLGLYSLLGFTYNVLASMIVPLIVVLAIADDVHIMQHWDEERRDQDAEQAFKNTIAHLAAPLFGASATTSLGMLSLATSDVVAVQSFGVGAAIGIMVDFVISLVVMPTFLSLVKPETAETPHERYLLPPLLRVARWSTRHPGRVFAASVTVALIASLGILRLRVDTNHINFFGPRHPLSQSAAVIDRQLAGVYSFQILLEGPPDSLKTPDALARIAALEDELRREPLRPEGHVIARLREADSPRAERRAPGRGRASDQRRHDCPGTVRLRHGQRRTPRAGAHRGQRLLARSDLDQAAGDELRPRARDGRTIRHPGEADVRRHRHLRHHDRLGTPVQHAGSLSGRVADPQLRHGVRDGLCRDLHRLPIRALRRPDDRAERAAGGGGARHHGVPEHHHEHRDGDGCERGARRRRRRHHPLHQPVPARDRQG